MSPPPKKKLRCDSEIKFVGYESDSIPSGKLPTVRQVLSFFFRQVRQPHVSTRNAAWNTIEVVSAIWKKTKIPLLRETARVEKILRLYKEWRTVCKQSKRRGAIANFSSCLDKMFDISVADALDRMESDLKQAKSKDVKRAYIEDIEFLRDQRDGLRLYVMGGLDLKMKVKENEEARRLAKSQEKRLKTEQAELMDANNFSEVEAAEIDAALNQSGEARDDTDDWRPSSSSSSRPASRGRRDVITPEVVQAIDAAKLSCYGAAEILSAATVALGGKVTETNINPSTIYRKREKLRDEKVSDMKKTKHEEVDRVLTVHWDGKKVESLDGVGPSSKKPHQEREAVIVTGVNTNLLLGSPALDRGNAEAISSAVCCLLVEWKMDKKVRAAAFDTTNVNSGCSHGVAVKLEAALGRELLWLPCRHHVFERLLESVYRAVMGPSSGPEDKIFTDLEKTWPSLDLSKYSNFQSLAATRRHLAECADEIIIFAQSRIQDGQPRADYLELLKLTIVFLGGQLEGEVTFSHPGAISSARWMSVALYCLRLSLFRTQMKLPKKVADGVTQVTIFVVREYVRAWFSAPLSVSAPRNDLATLKSVIQYKKINNTVSEAAVTRMLFHSWYLSEVMLGITVFDDGLPNSEKDKIVHNMKYKEGSEDAGKKRIGLQVNNVTKMSIGDLVTSNSLRFFTILDLKSEFLDYPVTEWKSRVDYQEGLQIVKHLRVVNDSAERAVKLFKDYNKIITKKEGSNQNLVVTVDAHRKLRPNFKKSTLAAVYDKQ